MSAEQMKAFYAAYFAYWRLEGLTDAEIAECLGGYPLPFTSEP